MTARTRSALTLTGLSVVLVLMVVIGWRTATAAFPPLTSSQPATCQTEQVKKILYRKDVTVSVFNASQRAGFAQLTMGSMENRHFVPGAVGNAPAHTKFTGVQVWTTSKDDPRATLVAQQYKPVAKVVVTENDLGPGVDVVLGTGARRPVVPAPKSVKLAKPETTCLDKVTVNPTTGTGQ